MSDKKNRVFLVSPYYPDQPGTMFPEIPNVCPHNHLDNNSCHIVNDHNRERKTGPCFPIRVLRCKTHKLGFTVYPPGHVPYGRQRIAPIEADSSQIINTPDEHTFGGTFFDAAIDANNKNVWTKEFFENSIFPRYSTQINHIKRASLLLGIAPCLDEKLREIISQTLNVPGQLIFENASLIENSSGNQIKGEAVCNILNELSEKTLIFERLATVGHLIGLWPKLLLWDSKYKTLRQPSFHKFRTRAGPY